MKFINKKSHSTRYQPSATHKKLSREELEEKVIEGANLVIKKYKKALTKLGDT